ncbi:hypothetical protein T06_12796 [Trichinella sp. T6]|nr:hypothetical protein T06_12796 [Trichinella sp. T6]
MLDGKDTWATRKKERLYQTKPVIQRITWQKHWHAQCDFLINFQCLISYGIVVIIAQCLPVECIIFSSVGDD